MANDKDFLLKNAVEVGGSTKVTLGTITGSNINLSTGNYFNDTLTANTTYTISNAGDVQSFQVEVTGGLGAFDLQAASDTGRTWPHSVSVGPISWNNDGTRLYVLQWSGGPIRQYDCSTAYDISTATLDTTWTPTAYSGAAYRGIFIGRSGTRLYLLDDNSTLSTGFYIREFNISTAYDLGTASTSESNKLTKYETDSPYGMTADDAFENIYVMGSDRTIYYYTLATNQQVGNAAYQNGTSYSGLTGFPRECHLNTDGTKMLVTGQNDQLDLITFTTAYTPSNGGTVETFDLRTLGFADGNLYGLAVKPDLSEATVADVTNTTLYTVSLLPVATLTWPSSIEWAGGVAPAAPANGETDVFTITTDDGGTSYIGLKTADNLS